MSHRVLKRQGHYSIDELIDHCAWRRLLRLRRFRGFAEPPDFDRLADVPAERLAEFPPHWVEAARRGEFHMPKESS